MAKIVIHSCPSLLEARKNNKSVTNYDELVFSAFLKDYSKGKKYFIYTHGCQANYRDSELYKGIFEAIGFKKSEDIESANIILINTCAVRENAENKVLGEIGNLKRFKNKKDVTIIIAGCMAMEEVIVKKLIDKYPHVDIIIGTHDVADIANSLEEHIKNYVRVVNVHSGSFNIHENLPSVRDSSFKAFVNITYGCNNFCTYCIVPYTRGRQRSRDKADIIKECLDLVKAGYQEITLLGQNVDSYGLDLDTKVSFASLLDEVASLNMPRLSFITSHPFDFTLEIIDVMKKHSNIMPYLHLPLQSGDDHILKLMGRKYDSNKYLTLVKDIRKKMPGIALSTDIIVGFPNESEEEFNNTLEIIKEVKYDSAFTFIYSPRSGTPAAKIKDDVSYIDKVNRFKRLTHQLELDIEENNRRYINNIYPVLVDSISKNDESMLTGRLTTNKIVNFKGPKDLIGKIVNVKIVSSHIHFLMGELNNN